MLCPFTAAALQDAADAVALVIAPWSLDCTRPAFPTSPWVFAFLQTGIWTSHISHLTWTKATNPVQRNGTPSMEGEGDVSKMVSLIIKFPNFVLYFNVLTDFSSCSFLW